MNLLPDKQFDPYYTDSEMIQNQAKEAIANGDLLQPGDVGFQTKYGDINKKKWAEMEKQEAHFKAIYDAAAAENCKLKFVAKYENGKASVGLQHIPAESDFYHLYGKDNLVLFYTERYPEQPLVIKGAGAGADVTASGVFADVIRVA
jgi:homoserine dehydrogenase